MEEARNILLAMESKYARLEAYCDIGTAYSEIKKGTLEQLTVPEQFYVLDLSEVAVDITKVRSIKLFTDTSDVTAANVTIDLLVRGITNQVQALLADARASVPVRNLVIEEQMRFFSKDPLTGEIRGVDPDLHVPYDHIKWETGEKSDATSLTIAGFYLQILGEVARGKVTRGGCQARQRKERRAGRGMGLSAQDHRART